MMYDLIKGFPAQLTKAVAIAEEVKFSTIFPEGIKNVVVSGLGGSGFGGDLLSELFRDELKVPVIVNKGYFLPAFVDSSSLLILSSYSGNTEEVISCAHQALQRGLRPICVTSGGALEVLALEHKLDLLKIPSGFPPRACLGYSAVLLFYVVHHFGLISNQFKRLVDAVVNLLNTQQEYINESAKVLAKKLANKVVVAYSDDKYESVLLRLKQQINENAKAHCWFNVLPEMNHNELVGWRKPNESLAVVFLRSDDEYTRITQRILFSKEIISGISNDVYEINAMGAGSFEKHFYLIHFSDWLSYHLALVNGYEPIEIEVLNKLKALMSSL